VLVFAPLCIHWVIKTSIFKLENIMTLKQLVLEVPQIPVLLCIMGSNSTRLFINFFSALAGALWTYFQESRQGECNNPWSPDSDENEISPCMITACSNIQMIRKMQTITKDKMSWYFNKFCSSIQMYREQ